MLIFFLVDQYAIEIDKTNSPRYRVKICFTKHMKVQGALVCTNGIANHSYELSFILKAILHSSPLRILIWWYPLLKSILVNICRFTIISNMSSNLDINNRYLTVIILMPLLLMSMCQLFLFGVRNATTQRNRLSSINILCNRPSTVLPAFEVQHALWDSWDDETNSREAG